MQKWSPDSFAPEPGKVVVGAAGAAVEFFPQEVVGATEAAAGGHSRFRREAGFATDDALMSHLTREARATVFELVEVDVAGEYEAKFKAQEEAFAARLEAQKQDLAAWAGSFQTAVNDEFRDLATACVEFSIQLAHKILRADVERDPETLIRALEATLHKVPTGHPMNLTVNPEDAEFLELNPEAISRLNIGHIHADRRIERGGCQVEAGGREWDATLSGQLEAMARLIRDQVAVSPRGAAGSLDIPFTGEAPDTEQPPVPANPSGEDDAADLG